MRLAIYFTPPASAEATRLAAEWLGRDAFDGAATRPANPAIDPFVAEPARYGFHATMKAPFRPTEDAVFEAIDARLAAFCAGRPVVAIDRLVLRRIDGFFALVPDQQPAALSALAEAVVIEFEPFRAPLREAEIAKRRPERLAERQARYLAEWGYPFVFEEFRFHMTLTGRVEDGLAGRLEKDLTERFAPLLDLPLALDGLALFVEPEPDAPFQIRSHHPFRA